MADCRLLIVDAVHHQVGFFGEPGPDGLLPAEVVSAGAAGAVEEVFLC
jgi:hypothetical protein